MPSIDEIRGVVSGGNGVARANMYEVIFTGGNNDLNLLCNSLTLPGRNVLTHDREIGLRREKVAYGATNEEVTMTFYIMNDYYPKLFFQEWQAEAFDQNTWQIGYKNDYVRDIQINQLLRGTPATFAGGVGPINGGTVTSGAAGDSIIYGITLVGAWPVTINSISLNNQMDGIVELTVTFSYTYWVETGTAASTAGLGSISNPFVTTGL